MSDQTRTAGMSVLVLVSMILAVSMSFIDQTIVAIASPDLQRDLGLTSNQGEWVINAYLVALAATFALGGRVADVWGARRMVLIGVAGFAVTSALCGATPDTSWAETWLIAARTAQGVFAAVLLPAAISIVYGAAPPERRGRSMAMFFGLTGAFTALGPILGSYLLEWSWRTIFWINLPVAAAALVTVALAPIDERRRTGRIDWLGAAIVAAGMALSVVGFSQATEWGWGSVRTWACLAGGAGLLVLFAGVERRRRPPLIRLDIFRLRGFRVDSGVLFFAMIAFVPVSYFLSVYASVSLGFDAADASHLLLLYFLGFLIAAQVGGRIFDARGAKPTILLGCVTAVAGYVWWATQVTTLDGSAQHHPLLLAGAGIGFLLGPSSADAVSRTHDASYGEVTGINQTIRNYGSALGFAVLGTLATHVFTDRFSSSLVRLGLGRSTADELAGRAASGGGTGTDLGDVPASARGAVERAVAHDFAVGMRAVLIAMAVALAVAFVIALRHPGDRPAQLDTTG
ncbi:MFS transporter [Jiangella alkaliphila]|uniref:Drug resistance transporter, EmrB/QacA subfamily n=1 Tax=Jiangella alkaliphila TaxID=419479 RepID=A0A1H2M707_9ACTN|nr:MFS transporter [Jiangella alkaliphila]SDU88681.1 drug resistance transporter, EmrB/QacA subfamily [Jiangella alkaliphila]